MRMMFSWASWGFFGWKDMPVAFLSLTGPMGCCWPPAALRPETNALGRRRSSWLSVFAAVYAVGAMTAITHHLHAGGHGAHRGSANAVLPAVWLLLAVGVAALIRRALKPPLTAGGEALACRCAAGTPLRGRCCSFNITLLDLSTSFINNYRG